MNREASEESNYIVDTENAITQYADMVFRIALVQMKNRSDADDIFQEVFLRLVQHKSKIKSEEHLKAWLIKVTINCCRKHFDNAWNKKTTSLDFTDVFAEGKYGEVKDDTVLDAVLELPFKYKIVVHLFYYEEYSIKEIAVILKQSESTIKIRLSRAREKLRMYFKGGCDERSI